MITFQELRITNDGNNLIIKAKVREESYYTNVYIDKVVIDTEQTYQEGGPSSNPVYEKVAFGDDRGVKSIDIIVSRIELEPNFREHLFFVYVITNGTPSPSVPCGMDNNTTLGVTFYKGNVYNSFLNYLKELTGNNCQIPAGFIDQLLRYKAMKLAFDTGHYTNGIEYYNRWFNVENPSVITTNCGCNG